MAKAANDELVDEIEEIRERLASTVDDLIERTNPKNMAARGLSSVKSRFVTDDGSPKLDTIGTVVGGTVAVVVGIVLIRKLLR